MSLEKGEVKVLYKKTKHRKSDAPSSRYIKEMLGNYGFIEISDILIFLSIIGEGKYEAFEYKYIRSKLSECIRKHDNGSEYFESIRHTLSVIDEYLYLVRT